MNGSWISMISQRQPREPGWDSSTEAGGRPEYQRQEWGFGWEPRVGDRSGVGTWAPEKGVLQVQMGFITPLGYQNVIQVIRRSVKCLCFESQGLEGIYSLN